MSCQNTLRARL